jgi:hypothetical protein
MAFKSQTEIANFHDFTTTFTNEYDRDQNAVVITPTSGKVPVVTNVYISCEAPTAAGQKVRVYWGTSGNTIATLLAPTAGGTFQVKLKQTGALNETIKVQSTLGLDKNYFVAINYREE